MAADSGSDARPVKGFPQVNNGGSAYIEPGPQFRSIRREAETVKLFQVVTETT